MNKATKISIIGVSVLAGLGIVGFWAFYKGLEPIFGDKGFLANPPGKWFVDGTRPPRNKAL
jgi:hypothetical protein